MSLFSSFFGFFMSYPFIASIITILILVVIIIFRSYIKTFLILKFGILKGKEVPLKDFCDDVKHVFTFKDHVVIPDYEVLYRSLLNQIDKQRKNGEVLVLDMSKLNVSNVATEESIRDAIRHTIMKNNVRLEIIISKKKKYTSFFEGLILFAKDKGNKSVSFHPELRKKQRG